jgi:hypothetical protein
MPILYSSQAGKAPPPPPWQGGVWGARYPLHCLYLLSKSSKIFFVCVPVGMPDVCMWYVVHGMRCEMRGYEVCGAKYEIWDTWHRDGVRGTPFDT